MRSSRRSRRSSFVRGLLAASLLGASVAVAGPKEPTRLVADPTEHAGAALSARHALGLLGIRSLVLDGRVIPPERLHAASLPLPAAVAVLQSLRHRRLGEEQRWIVQLPGGGAFPVAVTLGRERLRVDVGRYLPVPPEAPAVDGFRARFGTGPLLEERSAWDGPSRAALAEALRRLGPEERRAVAGLAYVRSPLRPLGRARGGDVLYEVRRHGPARLVVLDDAFDLDALTFVGPASDPMLASSAAILHGLGLAFLDTPARARAQGAATYRATVQARSAELARERATLAWEIEQHRVASADMTPREAWARAEELRARREALDAADARLDLRLTALRERDADFDAPRGPSGVTFAWLRVPGARGFLGGLAEIDPDGSFAAAFALWHGDPDALRRRCRPCAGWFEAGGHLQALAWALEDG